MFSSVNGSGWFISSTGGCAGDYEAKGYAKHYLVRIK